VLDYPATIGAHSSRWAGLVEIAGQSWTSMSTVPFDSVHLTG
jgi:hypothetical protein